MWRAERVAQRVGYKESTRRADDLRHFAQQREGNRANPNSFDSGLDQTHGLNA